MAFIVDQPLDAVDYLLPFINIPDSTVQPHPWTGIGTPIFILLARAGILVRHRRILIKLGWSSGGHDSLTQKMLEKAAETEKICLGYQPPCKNVVTDTGDPETGYEDLERLSLIYKLATLLELYRSFPELGETYLRNKQCGYSLDLGAPAPNCAQERLGNRESGDALKDQAYLRLLCDIATGILSLVEETRAHSPICYGLPLALIISGSMLQSKLCTSLVTAADSGDKLLGQLLHISTRPHVLQRQRQVVVDKLQAISQNASFATYKRILPMMHKFWNETDLVGGLDCTVVDTHLLNWIDIMEELKLTIFFG